MTVAEHQPQAFPVALPPELLNETRVMAVAGPSDPVNFITANNFFSAAQAFAGPTYVTSITPPPSSAAATNVPAILQHGVALTFNDKTICIIQFVRPSVWRIRFDPSVKSIEGYPDENTRNIVQDNLSKLVDRLDKSENIEWTTQLEETEDKSAYVFSSIVYGKRGAPHLKPAARKVVQLYLYKQPFRIQAVRYLDHTVDLYPVPDSVGTSIADPVPRVIWQTATPTFKWNYDEGSVVKNIVLNTIKPGPAEYLGFGEQGGSQLFKRPTYMNYFCYDNALSNQVFNRGPLDPAEPLYHSEPYFLEVNGNPNYKNINATFVDNYSQIAIDFGRNESNMVKIATRFGGFDVFIISANDCPEIIRTFTSLIGRPRLKPRFILGHHQGCYGYDSRGKLEEVVRRYRESAIPLDGLHIDVDFQKKYRTFTIDEDAFPRPAEMFANFRGTGVKCCTNITPVISLDGGPDNNDYPTLKDGLAKNVFIPDKRYLSGTTGQARDVRYLNYGGGFQQTVDPNDRNQRPGYGDNYDFGANFNSGFPYHGGVSYGGNLGISGYYPELNLERVRDWWGEQYKFLFDQGLEFVWQDMTTPAVATAYGDMKGFASRLLVSADGLSATDPATTTAIESWSLYGYNLHKATFHGLNKLETRKNKRNFVIGRGSSIGMYRFAGLWTGDNASTWDFWKISIAQVLALGLGGITISGVDMGGFLPNGGETFCDPDLLIRWYAGSFGLPWYRNHYTSKFGAKQFQEPYRYPEYIKTNPDLEREQGWLYRSVETICRYYVRLRYSLMQLLYDAMFESQINGLPIARSMFMTDTLDTTFLNESQEFLDNQYMIRNVLLVAPVMQPQYIGGGRRDVYLPLPDSWFAFNLRIDGSFGVPLQPAVLGGTRIYDYDASINEDPNHWPYVTPIYVREGSVVPQVPVRDHVGVDQVNPITLHVYPGKDNTYTMYLDDGVSRSSAPKEMFDIRNVDDEANGEYCQLDIIQESKEKRTITVLNKHADFDPTAMNTNKLTVVVWYVTGTNVGRLIGSVSGIGGQDVSGSQIVVNQPLSALVCTVPLPVKDGAGVRVEISEFGGF